MDRLFFLIGVVSAFAAWRAMNDGTTAELLD